MPYKVPTAALFPTLRLLWVGVNVVAGVTMLAIGTDDRGNLWRRHTVHRDLDASVWI